MTIRQRWEVDSFEGGGPVPGRHKDLSKEEVRVDQDSKRSVDFQEGSPIDSRHPGRRRKGYRTAAVAVVAAAYLLEMGRKVAIENGGSVLRKKAAGTVLVPLDQRWRVEGKVAIEKQGKRCVLAKCNPTTDEEVGSDRYICLPGS